MLTSKHITINLQTQKVYGKTKLEVSINCNYNIITKTKDNTDPVSNDIQLNFNFSLRNLWTS